MKLEPHMAPRILLRSQIVKAWQQSMDVLAARTTLAVIALALTAHTGLLAALGAPADWKLYAFTATKKQAVLFYLRSEIVRTPPGHVQVWIKALDYGKINRAYNHLDQKGGVFQNSAKKVATGYEPPFGTVTKLDQNQLVDIVVFEELANEASINPTLRVLYEIDCPQKLLRQVSLMGGQPTQTDSRVHEWEHVPPESTVDTLSKLICQ